MKRFGRFEWSAILTLAGVVVLFSAAIAVTLIAPSLIDPSWKRPCCSYQVQMYEVADPNVYVGKSQGSNAAIHYVYHLQEGFSLMCYQETECTRILAPHFLEKYVTRLNDNQLKLTTHLLLLKTPSNIAQAEEMQKVLQHNWKKNHVDASVFPRFEILEIYDPQKSEVFALTETDGIFEHWIDKDYSILDKPPSYATDKGVIFVKNPKEFRIRETYYLGTTSWKIQDNAEAIQDLQELKGKLKFLSRKELIQMGEDVFRKEGCWYCHTDQTRTLVQDTVLNGSTDYPAPPSTASEYVFQNVTFPGTRRIGPDLSRVGVKKASRDWHLAHFWSPKTESRGSLMPAFKHFFDNDPSGNSRNPYGIPNYRFEAVYQYLMTKGTRITPPSEAWWLGKDSIQTLEIIEGRK